MIEVTNGNINTRVRCQSSISGTCGNNGLPSNGTLSDQVVLSRFFVDPASDPGNRYNFSFTYYMQFGWLFSCNRVGEYRGYCPMHQSVIFYSYLALCLKGL